MTKSILRALLVLQALVLVANGQDWNTYPERKLFDFISQEKKLVDGTPAADMHISGKPFPAKTLVIYTGKKRTVGKYGKHFIDIWVQSRNVPRENADLLVEEYLFKEGDRELWMPVVKMLTASLERLVQPGEEILIYYFYLGGFNPGRLQKKDSSPDKSALPETDDLRWMLAVEEFEQRRSTAFAPGPLEDAIDRKMEAPGRILDVWFDPRQIRTRASLVFTGDVRSIPHSRQRLLDVWFQTSGFPASATALISDEVRFMDGNKEYWIAVRKTTLDEIRKTIKKGGAVSLNTILAGGIRAGEKVDWLFLAGEIAR
ncbi:MAG: hypothetical protein DMF63_12755 [Acidobacteria bacterium]|nr:MAG: hypothetical protein DMF63_12755 [Acidobacteriota bacterium]